MASVAVCLALAAALMLAESWLDAREARRAAYFAAIVRHSDRPHNGRPRY